MVRVAYRVSDAVTVERALHRAFHPWRDHDSREFFKVEPYQVEAILCLLGTEAGAENITEEVASDPGLIPDEPIRRRPRADFQVMGIPVGAEIICVPNGATAKVTGRHTVLFEDEELSLTAASRRILSPSEAKNPHRHWQYGDAVLWQIYERHYPI